MSERFCSSAFFSAAALMAGFTRMLIVAFLVWSDFFDFDVLTYTQSALQSIYLLPSRRRDRVLEAPGRDFSNRARRGPG